MPDIGGILNIGRQALSAHQRAISVTSGNIANVNTPGYNRRESLYETVPLNGGFGSGVQIAQVRSIVDSFLQRQVISEQSTLGRFGVEKGLMDRVESVLSDTNGINQTISDFFDAVSDLSNNPSGSAERTVLLERGKSLSQSIRMADTQLKSISTDVDSEIRVRVDEVNALAGKIAGLNKQIRSAEGLGDGTANDLRDTRVRLLGELSEKIEVHLLEGQGGDVAVTVGSGGGTVALVSGERSFVLSITADASNSGFSKILSHDGTDITRSIADGRLRGLIDIRDNLLPSYSNKLDKLAGAIVTEFNTQHQKGFALDGSAGGDFFSPLTPEVDDPNPYQGMAGKIEVFLSDPALIAAASAANEVPGGNGNAILLAKLQNQQISVLGSTFQGFYADFVGEVGARVGLAKQNLAVEEVAFNKLDTMQKEMSGVSLDEELTNLISFQRSYQAAAKLITTADELLQTVIGMKQ